MSGGQKKTWAQFGQRVSRCYIVIFGPWPCLQRRRIKDCLDVPISTYKGKKDMKLVERYFFNFSVVKSRPFFLLQAFPWLFLSFFRFEQKHSSSYTLKSQQSRERKPKLVLFIPFFLSVPLTMPDWLLQSKALQQKDTKQVSTFPLKKFKERESPQKGETGFLKWLL